MSGMNYLGKIALLASDVYYIKTVIAITVQIVIKFLYSITRYLRYIKIIILPKNTAKFYSFQMVTNFQATVVRRSLPTAL